MKKIIYLLILSTFISCNNQSSEEKKLGIEDGHYKVPLEIEKPISLDDRLTYSMAYELAENWGQDSLNLSINYMVRAIVDSKLKQRPLLDESEREVARSEFESYQVKKDVARKKAGNKILTKRGEKNKTEGPKFLEDFKKVPGVMSTESGVLYKIVKKGDGNTPSSTDIVSVNMTGKFTDEIEFEDTKRANSGEPVKIPINRMQLSGWREAVGMMSKGAIWDIVLPSELAYGEEGMPPMFPPHSVLIFQIELVDFSPKP